jgi:Na+/H+ antiporter NhaC
MSVPVQRSARSALPSSVARALAFSAILIGGLAGALIGYGFASVTGSSSAVSAFFAWVGATITALGTAIVAVLALRAMGEWRQLGDTLD